MIILRYFLLDMWVLVRSASLRLPMNIHNICLFLEIRKIIPKFSQIPSNLS